MNRDQAHDALELVITGYLAADHKGEVLAPAGNVAAGGRVRIVGEHAVDVDLAPVNRVEVDHYVLQSGLQVFVGIGCCERGGAVLVRCTAAAECLVVVEVLPQREVT